MADDEFENEMTAMSRVYSLREGKTLTLQDYEAIQEFDKVSRRDQERATDAFQRGYEQGLSEGGGAEIADLKARIRELQVSLATERGLKAFARADIDKLTAAVAAVANDFEPSRDSEAPLALSEMRSALLALVS